MRKSVAAFYVLPLFLLGCGGSKGPEGEDKAPATASSTPRNTVSFRFDTGTGGSSPVVLSFTNDDGYYKNYEGTWKAQKVRFSESSGVSNLSIWNGNLAIASYTFSNYRVSDFATVTKQSLSSQYSYYDSNIRTQIKFKLAPGTVSP